jgi:hypothetical protein
MLLKVGKNSTTPNPLNYRPVILFDSFAKVLKKIYRKTFLIYRAKALCYQDSLTLELLTTVLKENGYSPQQIRRAMEPAARTAETNDKPTSNAYIPYTQTTYGRLSRMLAKHNIKSVTLPP